jgi:alpha-beta hydrolase superfamily lysophospholipase
MKKKVFFRWLKLFLLVYGLVGISFYYGQEKLLFHPIPLHVDDRYPFPKPYTEVNIPVSESANIHLVQFPANSDSAKGLVLFFHGNKENITHYADYAPLFTQKGYSVWMMEYPGYGKSKGVLTEKTMNEWALQCYKLARKRYEPRQIILYGKSLGTGVAAGLAAVRDCKSLVLESPYYDLPSLFRPYLFLYPLERLLHYHFPTYQYLPRVDAPVTLIHGTNDLLIPLRNSRKLSSFFTKDDRLVEIEGGGHNNLKDYPQFAATLEQVLK